MHLDSAEAIARQDLLVAPVVRTSWMVSDGSRHFADSVDAGVWMTPESTLYSWRSSSVSGRTVSSTM